MSSASSSTLRPVLLHVVPRAARVAPVAPVSLVVAPSNDVDLGAATRTIAGVVFAATLAYAVVRYVVLGTVDAQQLPLYILNKAAAFTGVALLAVSLAFGTLTRALPRLTPWSGLRKTLGLTGFGFSAVHALATMALMQPAYYGKLYLASGRLSARAELMLLAGILSLAALVVPALTSFGGIKNGMAATAWKSWQRLAVVALVTAAAHIALLGYPTWITTRGWPGGLPPITLVSMLVVTAALVLRARR